MKHLFKLINHRLFDLLIIWLRVTKSMIFRQIHWYLSLIWSDYFAEFTEQICQLFIIWLLADERNIIKWGLLLAFVKGYLRKNSQALIDFLSACGLRGRAIARLFVLLSLWHMIIKILFNLFNCLFMRSLRFNYLFLSRCMERFNKILIADDLKLT